MSFPFGRAWNPATGRTRNAVYFDLSSHCTLIGPTGCGKGAAIELPALLGDELREVNIVSLDPTGQNFCVSQRWRSTFSDVVPLNPFHLHNGHDAGCNPLLSVETFEDAMSVAEAMQEVKPAAHEPFWAESAQGLIAGVVLAVVRIAKTRKPQETPTLGRVREILTGDLEGFAARMAQGGDHQLASLLSRYQKENRTIDSIKLHADTATRWLLSEPVARSLSVDQGIDWSQLKHGARPMSVYVILDADKLVTFAPWLKLITVSALNTLHRSGGGGRMTVFMLSEFFSLGKLTAILAGLGQGRKYSIRFCPMVLQNAGQLTELYGPHGAATVIGNSGCLMAFAPSPADLESAEFLSKAAGMRAVPGISASDDPRGGPARVTIGQRDERTWSPEKIRSLPPWHGLVWLAGQAEPQPVYCAPYWERAELRGRWDADPYHPSGPPRRARRAGKALAALAAAAMIAGGAWLGHGALWREHGSPMPAPVREVVGALSPAFGAGASAPHRPHRVSRAR